MSPLAPLSPPKSAMLFDVSTACRSRRFTASAKRRWVSTLAITTPQVDGQKLDADQRDTDVGVNYEAAVFRIFDVWESEEAWSAFLNDGLMRS